MPGVIVLGKHKTGVLWAIYRKFNGTISASVKIQKYNDSLALIVVKQQNSPISGVEFLQLVMETFPTAKRLLLNLYDDDDITARMPLLQTVEI